MAPRTRLDRLVWIRERREDAALAQLAGAERRLASARAELDTLASAAGAETRMPGDAALWVVDDAAHRRMLQAVKAAERQVATAAGIRDGARQGWAAAHQQAQAASRIAERRRAEVRADAERRERRDADEIATICHGRLRI